MSQITMLMDRINPERFAPMSVKETHYLQLPKDAMQKELEKIVDILLDLGFRGTHIDLAYVSGKGVRSPEAHPDKAEVYFMLTDTGLTLDGITYDVKAGDVVVIPANVTHQAQNPEAQYLMANVRNKKPEDAAFNKI